MLLQGGVDLDFLDLAVQGLLDLLKQVLVLVGGLLGGFLFLLGLQAQITGVDVLEFLLFVSCIICRQNSSSSSVHSSRS